METTKMTGACRAHRGGPVVALTLGLALALAAPAPAAAQGQGDKQAKMMQLKQRMQQAMDKLNEIQVKAVANDKGLKKERDRVRELIRAAMAKEGLDPEKETARLNKVAAKLKEGKLSAEERQKAIQTLREGGRKLQQAQMKALQNEKVAAASSAFKTKLQKAMVKADPKTNELLDEMGQIRAQMMALMGQR